MEHVEHLDGPGAPCGSGETRGRYSGVPSHRGPPSSATPSAEIVRANAIARVRYSIAQAEAHITTARSPIDLAFVPYWEEVAKAGHRALRQLGVQS